jgi:hypothetical protein
LHLTIIHVYSPNRMMLVPSDPDVVIAGFAGEIHVLRLGLFG